MASTWSSRVFLGVCDSPCPELHLSPFENKVGGYPDFYSSPVLSSLPSCRCCGAPLLLLVQVYCPLEGSPFHRLIHVFCCGQPTCWNQRESWLVLRSQVKDSSFQSQPSKQNASNTIEWCEKADNWGSESEDGTMSESTVSDNQLEGHETDTKTAISIATNHSAILKQEDNTYPTSQMEHLTLRASTVVLEYKELFFPPYYIRVIEEPYEITHNTADVEKLLEKYHRENEDSLEQDFEVDKRKSGSSASANNASGEGYEKGVAKHGDRTFQKFHKQLLKCPEQILRYKHRGAPLLLSNSPILQPPPAINCKSCGTPCAFEFQLMPPLVYLIQKSASDYVSKRSPGTYPKVEFGTLLVYTCSNSCWNEESVSFHEEHAIVMPDPDEKLVQQFLSS